MREDHEISDRAREVFGAFTKSEGITFDELARKADNQVHPKTLQRLLTTNVGLTQWQIEVLGRVMSREFPCDYDCLLNYILKGTFPQQSVSDLIAAKIYELKDQTLADLMTEVESAERGATVCRIFGQFPPSQILTERTMPKVLRYLASSLGEPVEHRFELMSRCGTARALRLEQGEAPRPRRTEIFLEREFLDVLREVGCTTDELDELLEEWIYNESRRNVAFGICDTAMRGIGTAVASGLDGVETIAVFDRTAVLRKMKGKPTFHWFAAGRSDGPQRQVIDRDAMLLAALSHTIPYSLTNNRDVERALRQFLSPCSWADRSCSAWRYRSQLN